MVFPRRGCLTCKTRRVKCDVAQPICDRCLKASRTCSWDSNDRAGLHFKSENAFAQGQPRRPKKAKEPPSERIIQPISLSLTVRKALSFPVELHAFHYWMANFTFEHDELPEVGHEYNMYAVSHFARAPGGSSLHVALYAVSHVIFGRVRHLSKAIEHGDWFYARSIARTHKEMVELSVENVDQLLLAIMLMGFYENLMYGNERRFYTQDSFSSSSKTDEVGSRFWKSVCHHDGALGLLKLRREKGSGLNLPLDKVIRRQLIRTSILRGITVPEWLENGADYGEEGPALVLDALMIRTAALRAESLALFSVEEDPGMQRWEDFAAEAGELDYALVLWSQTDLGEDWKFATQQPSIESSESWNKDPLDNIPVHIYSIQGYASVWNRYRAVRLIVNSIQTRSLFRLVQYSSCQRSDAIAQNVFCQQNIDSLTNDLCGSIPFFFNSLSPLAGRSIKSRNDLIIVESEISPKMAGLLAWPLTVAVSTVYTPEPQRWWLKSRLRAVANSLGDAMLNSVVERDEFKF